MSHVCFHQVTSGQGRAQREFTSEGSRTDDTGETTGVVTGVSGVRATDTKEVEHSRLRLEDGAAAEGADFKRRHGDADLQVAGVSFGFESSGLVLYR